MEDFLEELNILRKRGMLPDDISDEEMDYIIDCIDSSYKDDDELWEIVADLFDKLGPCDKGFKILWSIFKNEWHFSDSKQMQRIKKLGIDPNNITHDDIKNIFED